MIYFAVKNFHFWILSCRTFLIGHVLSCFTLVLELLKLLLQELPRRMNSELSSDFTVKPLARWVNSLNNFYAIKALKVGLFQLQPYCIELKPFLIYFPFFAFLNRCALQFCADLQLFAGQYPPKRTANPPNRNLHVFNQEAPGLRRSFQMALSVPVKTETRRLTVFPELYMCSIQLWLMDDWSFCIVGTVLYLLCFPWPVFILRRCPLQC